MRRGCLQCLPGSLVMSWVKHFPRPLLLPSHIHHSSNIHILVFPGPLFVCPSEILLMPGTFDLWLLQGAAIKCTNDTLVTPRPIHYHSILINHPSLSFPPWHIDLSSYSPGLGNNLGEPGWLWSRYIGLNTFILVLAIDWIFLRSF